MHFFLLAKKLTVKAVTAEPAGVPPGLSYPSSLAAIAAGLNEKHPIWAGPILWLGSSILYFILSLLHMGKGGREGAWELTQKDPSLTGLESALL